MMSCEVSLRFPGSPDSGRRPDLFLSNRNVLAGIRRKDGSLLPVFYAGEELFTIVPMALDQTKQLVARIGPKLGKSCAEVRRWIQEKVADSTGLVADMLGDMNSLGIGTDENGNYYLRVQINPLGLHPPTRKVRPSSSNRVSKSSGSSEPTVANPNHPMRLRPRRSLSERAFSWATAAVVAVSPVIAYEAANQIPSPAIIEEHKQGESLPPQIQRLARNMYTVSDGRITVSPAPLDQFWSQWDCTVYYDRYGAVQGEWATVTQEPWYGSTKVYLPDPPFDFRDTQTIKIDLCDSFACGTLGIGQSRQQVAFQITFIPAGNVYRCEASGPTLGIPPTPTPLPRIPGSQV